MTHVIGGELLIYGGKDPGAEELVGPKARNILALHDAGFAVPPAVCLTPVMFDEFLENANIAKDVRSALRTIYIHKTNVTTNEQLCAIRHLIVEAPFPSALRDMIMDSLTTQSIVESFGHLLAVRSCASLEDQQSFSAAGIYKTILNVSVGEALFDAIKKCWASVYTIRSLVFLKDQKKDLFDARMSVIIQVMVPAKKAGVLFTANPVTRERSEVLIEGVYGLGTKVVDGSQTPFSFIVDRATGKIKSFSGETSEPDQKEFLTRQELNELLEIGLRVEEFLGFPPYDIEWAMDAEGQSWILQARPISSFSRERESQMPLLLVDAANVNVLQSIDFLQENPLYQKEQWKKIPLRRFCLQHDVATPEHYWLIGQREDVLALDEGFFAAKFSSDCLLVDISSHLRGIFLRKQDLAQELRFYLQQLHVSTLALRLRTILPTNISALSSVTKEGQVLIEYAKGALLGLKIGYLEPSVVVLDRKGQVVEKIEHEQRFMFDILPGKKSVVMKELDEACRMNLHPCILGQICRATILLSEIFGEVRVEWSVWQQVPYALDMSIASRELDLALENQRVICPGAIYGKVIKIPSFGEVKDASLGFGISVGEVNDAVQGAPELEKYFRRIEAIKQSGANVILVAEKPYLGIGAFVDHVNGFIFEKGSLLCHLSIILREKNKPAVFLEGAMTRIREGTNIQVNRVVPD